MSKELVCPGNPKVTSYLDRSFGSRAFDIRVVSDKDGTVANFTANDFSGGLTKSGAPVLAGAPFVFKSEFGAAAAGSLVLAGVKVGDKVLMVTNLTDHIDATSGFESTITVAGHIQQSTATDLTAKVCLFFIVKQS